MNEFVATDGRNARLPADVLQRAAQQLGEFLASECPLIWPATGPAVEQVGGGDRVVFLKPTLVKLTTGAPIRDRQPVQVEFAFTEAEGLARYVGEISQNDLFTTLLQCGWLRRVVDDETPEQPAS